MRRVNAWAVSGLLAIMAGCGHAPPRQELTSLPRARWLQNGLIDAGGSHEPDLFLVRRGGQRVDRERNAERYRGEEVIRRLKEQGVEVFHTSLYKGFGMAAEMPEMEATRRVAALAHRHGLKVDTYIQWNTMMYETFFAEEPRAQEWIQRDAAGKPILLTYGYQQSYRYRPCFANRDYLEYLKRIVRYAVEEVKTDFIHFDNFDLNPEPDSCHDRACVRGFRDFLRRKYTPEQRRERFGFDNVDYVNPPQWNAQNDPARMEIVFDPAIQEWIDYRCQLMSDALREMALYAKSLNPEVAIEINPHGINGANRAWVAGLDHARLLKWTESFWTEEENLPEYLEDGRLISKIRSYKLARKFRNILLTYISGRPVAMAEALAFNQTLGFVGSDPLSPEMRKYISFYRAWRGHYQGSRDLATVAVLRSFPSIAYHNARTQLSAIQVEQALIQARIPFELVFDEDLEDLARYKVLILPDSECLSDGQLERIRRFVENGGGLLATGLAGAYDQWRRLRREPGLKGLVESLPAARAYEERVQALETAGQVARREVGRGRTAYLPAIQFDGEKPGPLRYFAIGNIFWELPRNAAQIVDSVRWLARDEIPVRVSGPSFLAANPVIQADQRRILVHLVNYDAGRGSPVRAVEVACRLPAEAQVKEVRLISPDLSVPLDLKFTLRDGVVSFTAPEVKVYAFAVVSW